MTKHQKTILIMLFERYLNLIVEDDDIDFCYDSPDKCK